MDSWAESHAMRQTGSCFGRKGDRRGLWRGVSFPSQKSRHGSCCCDASTDANLPVETAFPCACARDPEGIGKMPFEGENACRQRVDALLPPARIRCPVVDLGVGVRLCRVRINAGRRVSVPGWYSARLPGRRGRNRGRCVEL